MTERLRLLIPGPIELAPEVLAVMAEPLVAHYGEEWTAFYKETTRLLQEVFQTEGDIFLIPGSGSAGLDAALGSTLFPEGKVLIPQSGFFGERLAEIARGYTDNVEVIESPLGEAIDVQAVERALRDGEFDAVACVHCETSTGILNPIQELAEVCRAHDGLFIVDAVSSLAIEPLEMDAWGIDVCISASQKGLEAPPGVGVIAVGKRAWDRIEQLEAPGWYLNLGVWRKYIEKWGSWHPHPVTQPVNNIKALRLGVDRILNEGLVRRYERHRKVTRALREGLRRMGFEPYASDDTASHGLTSVVGPAGKVEELLAYMRRKERILLAGSLGALKGKVFRIGHMGPNAGEETVDLILSALERARRAVE